MSQSIRNAIVKTAVTPYFKYKPGDMQDLVTGVCNLYP